jgi:sec-independent protein translocase protein TatA
VPFGLSPIHLIAAHVIGVIILGPRRLPQLGAGAGRWIREFREGAGEAKDSFVAEVSPANSSAPRRDPSDATPASK